MPEVGLPIAEASVTIVEASVTIVEAGVTIVEEGLTIAETGLAFAVARPTFETRVSSLRERCPPFAWMRVAFIDEARVFEASHLAHAMKGHLADVVRLMLVDRRRVTNDARLAANASPIAANASRVVSNGSRIASPAANESAFSL